MQSSLDPVGHEDLIVFRKRVHEAEQPVSGGGIDQSINARERETVLGHALLRSAKSTHILHLPLDFFTKTTLASHSG
jgi:hypothetical protein